MRKFISITLLTAGTVARASVDVRLDGDRLWMTAQDASLREVMEAFSHAGVQVRFDPSIEARCNGVLTNAAADKALADLLAPFGYVISWDVLKGPVGEMPMLSEIQVFRVGNKQAAKPIADTGRLAITQLPGHPAFVSDEVLLGFKPGTSMDQVRALLAQVGGTIVGSNPRVGVYQIRLPPGANVLSLIDVLKRSNIVAVAEPNYAAKLPAEKGVTADATGKLRTPAKPVSGAATVAVLDSGFLAGKGFDAGVAGAYDAVQPGRALTDNAGHGTQMAMLVSGAVLPDGSPLTDNPAGVPVLAVRAFDDAGWTSNFALMRAIDYAQTENARVINLSWGAEADSEFVRSAIQQAQKAGMIVVAAAGNEATGKAVYPAALPGVVSVAALDADGSVWANSNYGSTVTVSAPGSATFPVGHDGPPGEYVGTSIASAYVSRALGEYLTKNPQATADQAIAALKASVTDSGTAGRDDHYGYGMLDAAALQRLTGGG